MAFCFNAAVRSGLLFPSSVGCVGGFGSELQLFIGFDQKLSSLFCMAAHIVPVIFLCDGDGSVGLDHMVLGFRQIGVNFGIDVLDWLLSQRQNHSRVTLPRESCW